MKCNLCPRNCNADREFGKLGYCKAGNKMVIARYSLHRWEEPIISGKKGSGTIFFSYCNMRCCFCQNYEISEFHKGRIVTIEEFSDICLDLEKSGASNINLVTPTHYVPQIASVLKRIKNKELNIPVVYNTSSYENIGTLMMMKGLVDIYLADLRYYDDKLGEKYSLCKDYFETATMAIDEMYRQVGGILLDSDGMIKRGLVVRVLILPGHVEDAKNIIKYLYKTYKDEIFISIMNQYTPVNKCKFDNLNRKVSDDEYDDVVNYAIDLGVTNAFVQEGEAASESFIPEFNKDII